MSVFGISRLAFNAVAGRLSARRKIARVHGSFYVVVPLEHAAVGIIPADMFIGALMEHLHRPYYVGGLSAAALYGAAHQRSQWYQVISDRPVRDISCRGVAIRFFVRSDIRDVPVQSIKVATGYIPVSTPEATAVDLVRYSRRLGGLDHILTVLQELGERIDPVNLVRAADSDGNVAYAQRLGWLMTQAGHARNVERLAQWVARKKPFDVKLEPSLPFVGSRRDARWCLRINTDVQGDLA
jgi:predicted transcriptional regulator of viral defense system